MHYINAFRIDIFATSGDLIKAYGAATIRATGNNPIFSLRHCDVVTVVKLGGFAAMKRGRHLISNTN